jgi:hypothetical protein
MMEKIKGPTCHTEVGERNFKETYVSPYNNQKHKCYGCLNCGVLEHQNKPMEFLEMVKGLLKEGCQANRIWKVIRAMMNKSRIIKQSFKNSWIMKEGQINE